LNLRRTLPILGDFDRHARIVEVGLREQSILGKLFGAIPITAGKRDVDAFRLDLVLIKLCLGCLYIRLRSKQSRTRLVKPRLKVLFVELNQDLAFLHDVADLDLDFLDDSVGFGFDLNFGYRLDLSDCDDRPGEIAPLHGSQSRRINFGSRPRHNGNTIDTCADNDNE
jgi:hypothetical protein